LILNSNGTFPGLKTWFPSGLLSSRIASGKVAVGSSGKKVTGNAGASVRSACGRLSADDSLVSFLSPEHAPAPKARIIQEIRILFMESPKLSLKIFIFEEFTASNN
jgi:hypothetical protein